MDEELVKYFKYQMPFIIVLYIFLYMCNASIQFFIGIVYIQLLFIYTLSKAISYEKDRYKNLEHRFFDNNFN